MKKFVQELDNTISEFNNQINDNLIGINYLESLKYHLINIIKKKKFEFLNLDQNILQKKFKNRELAIKIETFKESTSRIKNRMKDDCLSIVLQGSRIIEILSKDKSNSISLHIHNGVTLPKNTVYTENIIKDTLLLNIFDIEKIEDTELINKNLI